MKRTLKHAIEAIIIGIVVIGIGIILWNFPMLWLFPFGQKILAVICLLGGALIAIFGDSGGW